MLEVITNDVKPTDKQHVTLYSHGAVARLNDYFVVGFEDGAEKPTISFNTDIITMATAIVIAKREFDRQLRECNDNEALSIVNDIFEGKWPF